MPALTANFRLRIPGYAAAAHRAPAGGRSSVLLEELCGSGRQGDRLEEILGVKIVLTRIIYDAEQPVLVRLCIGYTAIDLAHLQRSRVVAIRDAHDVTGRMIRGCHHSSNSSCLIFISRRPMPSASYQWTSAQKTVESGSRTRACPFSLRHRPGPQTWRNLRMSRTRLPIAIRSTRIGEHNNSNCTQPEMNRDQSRANAIAVNPGGLSVHS